MADDLLQRTFLQAIKKIRAEGLNDPGNLGGYLYRTACKLAAAYWRGELSRHHDTDGEALSELSDEALTLEERLDHEQLAKHVRDLMDHLPVKRDREVLERFYLHEEPRTSIRESLRLTDLQFNHVLWRARQRFGDILRRHGFASRESGFRAAELRAEATKGTADDVAAYTREERFLRAFVGDRSHARRLRDRADVRLATPTGSTRARSKLSRCT